MENQYVVATHQTRIHLHLLDLPAVHVCYNKGRIWQSWSRRDRSARRGSFYLPHEMQLTGESKRALRARRPFEWRKVLNAIERHVRYEPTRESRSRMKRLRELAHPQYRLRVDDIRIFYDVVGEIVQIIAVIAKSQAAEWLAQEGRLAEPTAPISGEE